MGKIQIRTFNGEATNSTYDIEPDECPHCHNKITPRRFNSFRTNSQVVIIFQCPNPYCKEIFLGYYNQLKNGAYRFTHTSLGTVKTKEFSENITDISPTFTDIYNQSLKAEELGLLHVCGIGYRKALEFLIKDYLIKNNPDKTDEIKEKFLGKCIKEFIDNPHLRDIAERAVWLGNDETHYLRKWEDKDIKDLKILIDVTLHWIEMESLTEKYKEDMQ